MTKKKKATLYYSDDLFGIINDRLREAGLLPDILDYSLADRYKRIPVKSVGWECVGRCCFGGNEGIYLDIFLEGDLDGNADKVHIGTYKTLLKDKDSFQKMLGIQAEFVFALDDFVNEHYDDFNWLGYDVLYFRGDKKTCTYTCRSRERADALIERNAKWHSGTYDRVVIVDNETGEEEVIRIRKGEAA